MVQYEYLSVEKELDSICKKQESVCQRERQRESEQDGENVELDQQLDP